MGRVAIGFVELLFDTNILIYHLNGRLNETGTALLRQGLSGQGAYSIISRIEVLGFDQSEAADIQAKRILSLVNRVAPYF